ncbi:MAG: SRPBCC family protein [Bacteroidota bacterium]
MKIVKKILIGIVAVIAILLIVALFIKKDYTIEREVSINKPKQDVFDYIKIIKNQDKYSKWVMMDPNAKMNFKGTDGAVGFVSAWDSDKKDVGKGEQEITKIADGARIDLDVRFERPFKSKSEAWLTTESVTTSQTKVKWGFHGNMPYPFNILQLCMSLDKMIGDDLQTNLNNLKGVLEK